MFKSLVDAIGIDSDAARMFNVVSQSDVGAGTPTFVTKAQNLPSLKISTSIVDVREGEYYILTGPAPIENKSGYLSKATLTSYTGEYLFTRDTILRYFTQSSVPTVGIRIPFDSSRLLQSNGHYFLSHEVTGANITSIRSLMVSGNGVTIHSRILDIIPDVRLMANTVTNYNSSFSAYIYDPSNPYGGILYNKPTYGRSSFAYLYSGYPILNMFYGLIRSEIEVVTVEHANYIPDDIILNKIGEMGDIVDTIGKNVKELEALTLSRVEDLESKLRLVDNNIDDLITRLDIMELNVGEGGEELRLRLVDLERVVEGLKIKGEEPLDIKPLINQWLHSGRFVFRQGFYTSPSPGLFSDGRFLVISNEGRVISNLISESIIRKINYPRLFVDNYTMDVNLSFEGYVWVVILSPFNSIELGHIPPEMIIKRDTYLTPVGSITYLHLLNPFEILISNVLYISGGARVYV